MKHKPYKKYFKETPKYSVPKGNPEKFITHIDARNRASIVNDPNSHYNKRIDALLDNQPTWQTLEGQLILRVKNESIAAIPINGKKNAKQFVVFDINKRTEITTLNAKEVNGWLAKRSVEKLGF